jgi:hypothetical protein
MSGSFILSFFMIVVGIPVIGGIGSQMFKHWLKHKREMTLALNAQAAEKAAQYVAHTKRLERRMRVLERIVTDKGLDLTEEIEKLRDDRVN